VEKIIIFEVKKMDELQKMTNEELLIEYEAYYDMVYGVNPIYGVKDLLWLHAIENEMARREE
jgi:hypothetical protein